ncbi:MAG: YidB family protein [Gemmataceae bacterium]
MNSLVQFLLKLFGLGDNKFVEKLVTDVLLKQTLGKSSTSAMTGSTTDPTTDETAPSTTGGSPLEILMSQFQNKGLGNIFQSWVGTGKNDAITPEQVKDGIGDENLDVMAKKANLPVDILAEKLSKYLPGLIDKMTPGGKLPPNSGV